MNIYVMRHGTTVWNEKQITQGHSKNRLSKVGQELVYKQAEKFKNTKFDIIISSPLMRTMQTANIMNKYHNVKIIKDPLLIEIDQGIFTGRKNSSLTEQEKILKNNRSKKCCMETFEEVFTRTNTFLQHLKNNIKYHNILIVTHNCNASFIKSIIECKKVDFKNANQFLNFDNAEIIKLEL